jgi:hypothetical protein
LLESIERLVEATDMIRTSWIHKPRRLLTVNHLIKVAIEEGILDIKLTNWPKAGDGYVKNQSYSSRLDDRTKSLVVVYTRALRKSTDNPSCLVSSKRPIGVKLLAKDPLASHYICLRWSRNQGPCAVVEESLMLFSHSSTPPRVLHSLTKSGGNRSSYIVDDREV